MIQPARVVLPSNAPPLPDATGGSHAPIVLQEHSGNSRPIDYSYVTSNDQKYPTNLLAENAYAGYQSQPPQHVYRPTALAMHHYRYGLGSLKHPHDHPADQARREKQARFLDQRFRESEDYMKYRGRQQKEGKAGQEQKWPDRLEWAFFRALVQWPPMGRRQLPHKDKQRGRNELIADYIEELTGEARTRKQVSSHIQVLKAFVKHDPHITRWLSEKDMGGRPPYGGRTASLHDTRRASHYAAHASSQPARLRVFTMSKSELYSLSQNKTSLDLFEPIDFQMFVQRKLDDDHADRLHTYTSSIKEPLRDDLQLHDCPTIEDREARGCTSHDLDIHLPLLATMHKHRPLDCNVLLAEASLSLDVDTFKDADGKPIPGVELGISFRCKSRHLPVNAQVQCQNMFYQDGHLLREHSGASSVVLMQSEDTKGVETQIKFGSNFWARTLAAVAVKLRSTTDESRDFRQEVVDTVQGITVCQEVSVLTEAGPERLLVIYWKFRLSSASQGRAYWMRVLLPPTQDQQQPQQQYPTQQQPKSTRVDSVYDYTHNLPTYPDPNLQQPTLQSPFEYDTTTSWPATLDAEPASASTAAANLDFTNTNDFDFSGGNISISYDPALDFSNFDSSGFYFDALAAAAADPAASSSQEYSQSSTAPDYSQDYAQSQEYSQPAEYSDQWCENYSFDSQQSVTGASSYPVMAADTQTQQQQQQQQVYDSYGGHYGQTYEGQAYGGAGQEAATEEDHFAALADASHMARMLPVEGQSHEHQTQM